MRVDIAIITVREDEYEAVLQRFKSAPYHNPGRRTYGICHVKTIGESTYTIAIARCSEQGNDASQRLAHDIIDDLDPQLILVVGIAGGVPHDEFTLGDVIVSTRIHNLNVGAQHEDASNTFDIRGGIHPRVSDITSNLPLYKDSLSNWNEENAIGQVRPEVNPQRAIISGDDSWRKKVRASLKLHFGLQSSRTRLPKFKTGSIASSNYLIRNPLILNQWRDIARTIVAVEMEAAGVYEAAQGIQHQYPVMAIRGISDIIGLQRDGKWTTYACHTAASFAYAFIMTKSIDPRMKTEPPPMLSAVYNLAISPPPTSSTKEPEYNARIKDRILYIDLEPELYGKSAARGIYDLVQTWPEEYDLSLAKREGRSESGASFLAIWDEKQEIVFDKQFQQLRQELWGEQSERIENEVLQQMEDAKRAIRSLLETKGTSAVLAPYNAAPDMCEVSLQRGVARVRYKDNHNLGIATSPVRAEVVAGSNMFARMYYKPKAQEAYALGLLEIPVESQEQLDDRFAITRAIVCMGPVYLASYAMDRSINPGEHLMARKQLTNLPNNLRTVNSHYRRLSTYLPSGKSQGVS